MYDEVINKNFANTIKTTSVQNFGFVAHSTNELRGQTAPPPNPRSVFKTYQPKIGKRELTKNMSDQYDTTSLNKINSHI